MQVKIARKPSSSRTVTILARANAASSSEVALPSGFTGAFVSARVVGTMTKRPQRKVPIASTSATSHVKLEVIRGRPADAIPVRKRSIEIFREEGDVWKVANNLTGLAMLSRMAGDIAAARDHLREALAMFVNAKDSMSIGMTLTGLALIAIEDGLPARAARLVGAAARIRADHGGGVPPELMGRWGDPAADARQALGDDVYEAARAAGYAMEPEAAVEFADDRATGAQGPGNAPDGSATAS